MKRFLSTIEQTEIAKFAPISKEWWNPKSTLGTGPLHYINPIRVQYITQQTTTLVKKRILDVGCGGGILSESLCRLGGKLHSIDPSHENIQIASLHANQDPITATIQYEPLSLETLIEQNPLPYDIVCSLEVIEHVNHPELFVQQLTQLVKPEGYLFLSTFNRTMLSYLLGIVALEKVFQLVPNGTHEWDKFITPQELSKMLTNHGMTVVNVSGIVGDPFFTKWRLSNDPCGQEISYILCAKKNPPQ